MAKIRIGEATYTAEVRHSGRTLAVTFDNARIEEIAALLSEEQAPQITVLRANGTIEAIYRNHALTSVKSEVSGGKTKVCAVMTTEEIAVSKADAMQEEINALKAENELLTACVLEMSERVYA